MTLLPIRRGLALFMVFMTLTPSAGAEPLAFPKPADAISDTNRAILDPWTGSWRGIFKVYTQDGRLVTTLEVQQTYRWDGPIQRARFRETNLDTGEVVTAKAANFEDQQGQLVCTVEKSNGERSLHVGRLTDDHLFWTANRPGTLETFKERVVASNDGRSYEIQGFGLYGRQSYLFHGVYQEVAP